MTNPFENAAAACRAPDNAEGQHPLWPGSIAVPAGWSTVYGPENRAACLDLIETRWTDIHPIGWKPAMDRFRPSNPNEPARNATDGEAPAVPQ